MRLQKNEYYYETKGFINVVAVTGGEGRIKSITYHIDGIQKYSFAVASELFKNKEEAFKYFGHKNTIYI